MSDSEEMQALETSSVSEKNSSGSSPPPNNSSSDGKESSPYSADLQEPGDANSASPPAPISSNSSNYSPPPDDSSNEPSPSPPSDSEPPETSPPPPPPEKSSPPPNIPSPPSSSRSPPSPPKQQSPPPPSPSKQQSPPPPGPPPNPQSPPPPNPPKQQSPPPPSTSPKQQSPPPPSPPNQQSPPPASPPKQQSSPPLSSPSPDSSQSSPEKSPPPPHSSEGSPSPSPPSSETSQSPHSPVFSPPSVNGSTTSSHGFSPHALAPRAPSKPKSPSNSSGGSSHSGGSNNNGQNNINDAKNPRYEVAIDVTVAGVFIIAFVALFFFIRRRKKRQPSLNANYMPPPANFGVKSAAAYYKSQLHGTQSNLVNNSGSQRGQNHHGPDSGIIAGSKTFFTYEELMEMTNGFARENIIGEGGFGCVYKGWMPDGRLVAVKQLKAGSGQGEREFQAEVEIISRVHHRHLVSLVGYCIAENQRLLIYEFVANKTLEHHLHDKKLPVLEWAKRVKIAVGAAKGLAYLHEDCHPRIIHRDIKSANILLEDDFEAQVADFGLARLNDTTQTHVSTRVMGTFGYLAPEYASSGKLTDRSDVYSFGVVLLELITGRKPVDPTQPLGDESLVEWARPLLIQALETGDFGELLIDPRLEKRYVESEMFMMIEAAAACVRHSAAKRPRMALVVRALDFDGKSDLSNGVKFGHSTAYDSGQYNEEIMNFRKMALGSDNSSESDIYSGEYNSKEVSRGQPSWKSGYSSGEFTSGDSETQAFKPNSGGGHLK